jgi:hypothetical protein
MSRRSSGWAVGGVQGLSAGFDLDCAVAAGGSDEFRDAPAGLVFDPVADGRGGEHDRQVGVDGLAFVVVDRAGLQVVFGHAESLLDAPQLVIGVDDELRGLFGEVGGVALEPGQAAGFGLQIAIDANDVNATLRNRVNGEGGSKWTSRWRLPTTLPTRDQPPAEFSHQKVSGLTGALHASRRICRHHEP